MTFIVLKDAINGADIAVNASRIRFVRRATNGRTLLVFDNEHTLTVAGTLEEIVSALDR